MITFNVIDIICDSQDSLAVYNEDRSYMIFDYCNNQKNTTNLGDFVIAKAKYLLIRMQTFNARMLSSTFDLFLLDDPNQLTISTNPPVLVLTSVDQDDQTSRPLDVIPSDGELFL